MKKLYTSLVKFVFITAFIIQTLYANAQNLGFEAPAASPPANWAFTTGTWSTNTDLNYVRTGKHSMMITDPATSGTTGGNTSGFVTTTSTGNYLITIAWGKSNTASNGAFNLGYRSGSTNTLNPSSTSTPPASNRLNDVTWTRITSASTATVGVGSFGPAIRAFRVASVSGTTLYIDDFITYASPSNVPDLTPPDAASNGAINSNTISWTNGMDNGSPASGIGGVVILRADGGGLAPPFLNDQAMYSPTEGEQGVSSIFDGVATWTVVGSINDNTTQSFTDVTAGPGPYTYAIYMRDLAYNYSPAITVGGAAAPCTSPPVAGSASVNPSGQECGGVTRILNLQGATSGSGQTYRWLSSSTQMGTYTYISATSDFSFLIINPDESAWYRAELTCNGISELSDPVEVLVTPQMSGIYSINPGIPAGGTNFHTFAEAIAALNVCGISSPVVFEIATGTYPEQVVIPPVNGASEVNTVTFRGIGNVVMTATPVTGNRPFIRLDGADFIHLKNITMQANAGSTFGWGIHLTGGADNNVIDSCTIDLSVITNTTQSNSAGIVASGSNTSVTTAGSASFNTITNNTVIGGYQGIRIVGAATALNAKQNVISNNIVRDFYADGIALVQNDSTIIRHNDISRALRSTGTGATTVVAAFAGIELGTGNIKCIVDGNKIHDTHNSAGTDQNDLAYGISSVSNDAPVGEENRIINNLIYNFNSATGVQHGLHNSGSDGIFYYHNTVVLDDQASTAGVARGFNQVTTATNIELKNNIFVIGRAGSGDKHVLYFGATGTQSTIASDNNVLYLTSTGGSVNAIGHIAALTPATNYPTIADWKAAEGAIYDQSSEGVDPMFVDQASEDFTPSNPFIDNIGAAVGVETDILNTTRNLNAPDPGVIEWASTVDLVGPGIVFTPLEDTISLNNRTITVTISDVSGVQQGTSGPRLYYRKTTDPTYVFDASPSISGNEYTFTFDYAALGGITSGTIIEYYIAAQDSAGNLSTSPAGGSGVTPPGTMAPSSGTTYLVIPILNGLYTIGTGGTYMNLTALANALNTRKAIVGGNTVFELLDTYDGSTGETLPIVFNEFESTGPNYSMTIRPAAGVSGRITSGDPGSNFAFGVISLDGGDRFILDGRPGGTGTENEWTLRNTRTSSAIGCVLRLVNGATNNIIRNLNLESEATLTTTGALFLHTSTDTIGNSFNVITENHIRGRVDVANASVSNGILSNGSAAAPNSDNTISNNHIYNFGNHGISLVSTNTGNGPNWNLTGNHIYNAITPTASQSGIITASSASTNMNISGNFIGGSGPGATGIWNNSGNVVMSGITVSGGAADVRNNLVANISNSNAGVTARMRGIFISSTVSHINVNDNTIHDLYTAGTGTGIGFNSSIAVGIAFAPSGTFVKDTVRNNTIYNIGIDNPSATITTTNIAAGISAVNFQNGLVSANKIYNIRNNTISTTPGQPPVAAGIVCSFADNGYFVNNMIALGENENTNTQFAGIYQVSVGTSNNHHYYHNSIVIGGNAAGDFSSYGFVKGTDTSTLQNQISHIRNNILYMLRSGGGSNNYPIGTRGAMAINGLNSNNNVLYNTTGTNIGYLNNAGYDLAGWQAVTGGDANSASVAVTFADISAGDLHLAGSSIGDANLSGDPLTSVTEDFDNDPRSLTSPYMGADEASAVLSVILEYFTGVRQGNDHLLTWKASCSDNTTFFIERSSDGRNFNAIGSLSATPQDCLNPLQFTDKAPLDGINYYRLRMQNREGRTTYSIVVALINKNAGFEIVGLHPSLVTGGTTYLNVTSTRNTSLNVHITDISGRMMQQMMKPVSSGSGLLTIDVSKLPQGVYHLTGTTPDGYYKTLRFVKQ